MPETTRPPHQVTTAALCATQALLQVLDLASTTWALGNGAVEANPISRAVLDGPGWWAYATIKFSLAAVFLALWPLVASLTGGARRLVVASFAGFAVLMLGVVLNNIIVAA